MKNVAQLLILIALTAFVCVAYAEQVKSVVIDPGHGGYDFGLDSAKIKEKDFSTGATREIASLLKPNGFIVYSTRKIDRYVSIRERILATDKANPDVFLSLHATNAKVFYLYTSWYPEAEGSIKESSEITRRQRGFAGRSKQFAAFLAERIKKEFPGSGVTLREMPLPLIGSVDASAVLIEMPVSYFGDSNNVKKFSKAVAEGIKDYARQ